MLNNYSYSARLLILIAKILPNITNLTRENILQPNADQYIEIIRLIELIRLKGQIYELSLKHRKIGYDIANLENQINDGKDDDQNTLVYRCKQLIDISKKVFENLRNKQRQFSHFADQQRLIYNLND
ncbi:hypothetical protein COBT_002878 [Conglomerata obtusa]